MNEDIARPEMLIALTLSQNSIVMLGEGKGLGAIKVEGLRLSCDIGGRV
jgi:hypothetical protein